MWASRPRPPVTAEGGCPTLSLPRGLDREVSRVHSYGMYATRVQIVNDWPEPTFPTARGSLGGGSPRSIPMSYDLFISYSRVDNDQGDGRITQFVERIGQDFAACAGRPLRPFFDRNAIAEMEDWRHTILPGLREVPALPAGRLALHSLAAWPGAGYCTSGSSWSTSRTRRAGSLSARASYRSASCRCPGGTTRTSSRAPGRMGRRAAAASDASTCVLVSARARPGSMSGCRT